MAQDSANTGGAGFESLPSELILAVLDRMPRASVFRTARISRRLRAVAVAHSLYRARATLNVSYGTPYAALRIAVALFRGKIAAAAAQAVRIELDVSATYEADRWLHDTRRIHERDICRIDNELVAALREALPLTVHLHMSVCERVYDLIRAMAVAAPMLERLHVFVWASRRTPACIHPNFLASVAPRLRVVALRNVALDSAACVAFRCAKHVSLRVGYANQLGAVAINFPSACSLDIDISEDPDTGVGETSNSTTIPAWGSNVDHLSISLGKRETAPAALLALVERPISSVHVTWISSATDAPDDLPIAPYMARVSGPFSLSLYAGEHSWETVLCIRSLDGRLVRRFSAPTYLSDANSSSRSLLGRDVVTQNFAAGIFPPGHSSITAVHVSWELSGEVDSLCAVLPALERVEVDFSGYESGFRRLLSQHADYFEGYAPPDARALTLALVAPPDEHVALRANSVLRLMYDYRLLRAGARPRLELVRVALLPSARDVMLRHVLGEEDL